MDFYQSVIENSVQLYNLPKNRNFPENDCFFVTNWAFCISGVYILRKKGCGILNCRYSIRRFLYLEIPYAVSECLNAAAFFSLSCLWPGL